MSDDTETPSDATVFALPEQSLFQLVQMQHHLRLMAQIGESSPELPVQPDTFAWWTKRLAAIVEDVIETTYYSTELAMGPKTNPAPAQS